MACLAECCMLAAILLQLLAQHKKGIAITMSDYQKKDYAGFWRRLLALLIDSLVVWFIALPLTLVAGLIWPNSLSVAVPFGLFTKVTMISHDSDKNTSIVREDVLNLWTSYYQIVEIPHRESKLSEPRIFKAPVDPHNHARIEKTTTAHIALYIIIFYWILFEASAWQASVGKKVLSLKVVTSDGGRPSLSQCAMRNLLKILSSMTFFIGFFMAGWTGKKQALHDKLPGLLVIKRGKSHEKTGNEPEAGSAV